MKINKQHFDILFYGIPTYSSRKHLIENTPSRGHAIMMGL